MAEKRRWPLEEVRQVANALKATLANACEVIEIAGSVRRQRRDPGDIELLVVPRSEQRGNYDLLGAAPQTNVDLLNEALQRLLGRHVLEKRKLASVRYAGNGTLNMYLEHVESDIPVDIFSASMDNFGMALLVRT